METALKDICESIARQVDLRVVVANDKRVLEEEESGGFHLTRLPNWRTIFSQPVTPALWAALRREPAEIVHLHEPNPLALALFSCQATAAPGDSITATSSGNGN
jgi:rhamnosyl/mannosyltransferase